MLNVIVFLKINVDFIILIMMGGFCGRIKYKIFFVFFIVIVKININMYIC